MPARAPSCLRKAARRDTCYCTADRKPALLLPAREAPAKTQGSPVGSTHTHTLLRAGVSGPAMTQSYLRRRPAETPLLRAGTSGAREGALLPRPAMTHAAACQCERRPRGRRAASVGGPPRHTQSCLPSQQAYRHATACRRDKRQRRRRAQGCSVGGPQTRYCVPARKAPVKTPGCLRRQPAERDTRYCVPLRATPARAQCYLRRRPSGTHATAFLRERRPEGRRAASERQLRRYTLLRAGTSGTREGVARRDTRRAASVGSTHMTRATACRREKRPRGRGAAP